MKQFIKKASVLIEALPYIQRFRKKIVVVKYGGSAMKPGSATESILRDIVFMECVGMRPVLVHGGGDAITRRLKAEGIETRFVEGMRVTNWKTMKLVEDVLIKEVNAGIVSRISAMGGRPVGLSGRNKGILRGRKMRFEVEKNGVKRKVDLGFVGYVERVDAGPLHDICEKDKVPVIAPIAVGEAGEGYNVNADVMAGEIAVALKAQKLVFLTDVRGIMRVKGDPDTLISTLRGEEARKLIKQGRIREGMIPKVKACIRALEGGVKKAHVIDGKIPHSLLLEIFTDRGIGTEIVG